MKAIGHCVRPKYLHVIEIPENVAKYCTGKGRKTFRDEVPSRLEPH